MSLAGELLILVLAIFAGLGPWGVVVHSPGETAPPVSREPESRPSMGGWSGVDLQRNSFEIRDQSRERVIVSVPFNARRSDVDRFRALQAGDYVRVEGRFLDRERFELDSFLRDDR